MPSKLWSLLKLTGKELWRQPIHQMAAALSFFALFALPPLVLVLMVAAGEVIGDDEARTTTLLVEVERNWGTEARDLVADGDRQHAAAGRRATCSRSSSRSGPSSSARRPASTSCR